MTLYVWIKKRNLKASTGALGSWGAALLEPYSDRPDTRGIMRINGTTIRSLVQRFAQDVSKILLTRRGSQSDLIIINRDGRL